jgi:hypothetical protein
MTLHWPPPLFAAFTAPRLSTVLLQDPWCRTNFKDTVAKWMNHGYYKEAMGQTRVVPPNLVCACLHPCFCKRSCP